MRRRRRALTTTAFLPLLAAPLAREEALPPSRHQHLCVPWTASLREALTRSNAFLPDPAAFVSHPPVDAAAERLRRQLRRLGESCRAPFLPIGGTNAFGSLVNALVLPLKFAVASNRTMLTPPLGAYANGSCATLACFYRPLAPAGSAGRGDDPAWLACRSAAARLVRRDLMPRADAPGLGAQEDRCRPSTCGVCDSGGLLVCLAAPCARFCSVWSHAPQILCLSRPRHLLRPNDATRRRVGRRAEAAGLRRAPRPLLGIHVRRGDSCREVQEATKARRCSPFAEYWYHALAMRARGGVQAFISVARSSPQARYGIRSVFLATDDPSVVDEARTAAATAGLPLYAMLANPPASAGTAPPPLWDSVLARRGVDASSAAAGVVDDLALLD